MTCPLCDGQMFVVYLSDGSRPRARCWVCRFVVPLGWYRQ